MAAGKSTVAQALAERLPKSVHLRGDIFRRMIVNGRAEMGFELSQEALAQLRLRYELAATVALSYLAAGFTVVYQDIVIGQTLVEAAGRLSSHPLYVVVLCPTPEAVIARETSRSKRGYRDEAEVYDFDRVLRTETPRLGLWLDTSSLTVGETVEQILARLSEAQVN
jgi:predicted kinase